ncbi:MAG: AI-2E family transporter [Intrasporangium sp.]|uniref:AI-2E family transporter n=1 Tax=Intrasporangium sp. TaxID=1925024 RepID=UPI002648EB13|nr:AI-2E family transporter [Intrasporangium sp.]MDN5795330.1 AI-2E family transporter [Intrasporangium sp.]
MTEKTTVPRGIREASSWAGRLLLIAAALAVLYLAVAFLSPVLVPIAVALLLTALLRPLALRLHRWLPLGAATGVIVLGTIVVVGGLLTLVGTQFTNGFGDLTAQVADGVNQIRDWVRTTFHITDTQFNAWFDQIRETISSSGDLSARAASIGLTATHFVAGIFVALFALFFFLYDGPRIWQWVVRLFPRAARDKVGSSGQIAWHQLSAFVRATIIVAAVDAIGISLGAAILEVPFAFAIGVLVFILSFIPIVGALLSGAVAVLLALVAHGPGVALIMLAVVIGVQQIESHVLQPFLLGRAVSVHPLAVILGIAAGSLIAGIVGALLAVPTMAILNAVGKHLLSGDAEPDREPEPDPGLAGPVGEGPEPANA